MRSVSYKFSLSILSNLINRTMARPYDCTICERGFKKRQWLEHLLDGKHPPKGRKEFKRRCFDKDYQQKLIVIESTKPVANYGLLEHFWNGRYLVSDFVWWEDESNIGFMLLEDEKKVAKIMNGSDKIEIIVGDGDQLLEVRQFDIKEWAKKLSLEKKKLPKGVVRMGPSVRRLIDLDDSNDEDYEPERSQKKKAKK